MTIETKFNVGQEVVFIFNNKIKVGHIDAVKINIDNNKTNSCYYVSGIAMLEKDLFCNKEELFNVLEQQLSNAKSQKTL